MYGSVTIEYESPGKLATKAGQDKTFRQCRQYMREQTEIAVPGHPEEALPKLVAVTLDGEQIGFVQWRATAEAAAGSLPDLSSHQSQMTLEVEEGIAGGFQEFGPTPVTADSITDLLLYLRALSRRPLEASALAEEFGPSGDSAREVIGALDRSLREGVSSRTAVLYEEWLRLFGAIYGERSKIKGKAVADLSKAYGLPDADVGRMLFAVHTYFALIMKILAVELVALQAGFVIDPFVAGLSSLPDDEFDARFEQLESGAEFRAPLPLRPPACRCARRALPSFVPSRSDDTACDIPPRIKHRFVANVWGDRR